LSRRFASHMPGPYSLVLPQPIKVGDPSRGRVSGGFIHTRAARRCVKYFYSEPSSSASCSASCPLKRNELDFSLVKNLRFVHLPKKKAQSSFGVSTENLQCSLLSAQGESRQRSAANSAVEQLRRQLTVMDGKEGPNCAMWSVLQPADRCANREAAGRAYRLRNSPKNS